MYALKAMWQILWGLPLAVLWVLMYLVVVLGWGLARADKFIIHWNNMVNDDTDDSGPWRMA